MTSYMNTLNFIISNKIILSSQEGETVLHVAATSGQLETVEALLDRGCDANVQDFVSLLFVIVCCCLLFVAD